MFSARAAGKTKPPVMGGFVLPAGGKGFEPLLADSESAVLPLDEPPNQERTVFYHAGCKQARNLGKVTVIFAKRPVRVR